MTLSLVCGDRGWQILREGGERPEYLLSFGESYLVWASDPEVCLATRKREEALRWLDTAAKHG